MTREHRNYLRPILVCVLILVTLVALSYGLPMFLRSANTIGTRVATEVNARMTTTVTNRVIGEVSAPTNENSVIRKERRLRVWDAERGEAVELNETQQE